MADPIVRETTSEDVEDLRSVLDATELFPSALLSEMLTPFLAGESEAFWLTCDLDGNAVGLCYTAPEDLADGTWNMLALAVHPAHQGMQIGSALAKAAEQRLRAHDQRILIADTSGTDEFVLTRKFYLQNGYDEEARIRDFWAPGDDKVTFRKAL